MDELKNTDASTDIENSNMYHDLCAVKDIIYEDIVECEKNELIFAPDEHKVSLTENGLLRDYIDYLADELSPHYDDYCDDYGAIMYKYNDVSNDFIEKNIDKFNLNELVSQKKNLSEKVIDEHFTQFNILLLLRHQQLSDEMLEKHFDYITEKNGWFSLTESLSADFMMKHPETIHWNQIAPSFDIRIVCDKFLKHFHDEIKRRRLDDQLISLDEFNKIKTKKSINQRQEQFYMAMMLK